ncbi:hypothetical protein GAGA_3549 [Paraglaciecola agarilytica NO2]|uniref:Uncharacterized protein n=1 Tax=Paraglaciecola agarilytica NO2 TaxID=1125747 RepID=A0ABQ0IAH8_9ALTE|nr:hypothetical protein GAGA_3549 [Paraglaciecola agarilytica NO2]
MKARLFLNFLKQKYGSPPAWEQRVLMSKPELSYVLYEGSKYKRSK